MNNTQFKQWRKGIGASQVAMGKRLGVNQMMVSRIENGFAAVPASAEEAFLQWQKECEEKKASEAAERASWPRCHYCGGATEKQKIFSGQGMETAFLCTVCHYWPSGVPAYGGPLRAPWPEGKDTI